MVHLFKAKPCPVSPSGCDRICDERRHARFWNSVPGWWQWDRWTMLFCWFLPKVFLQSQAACKLRRPDLGNRFSLIAKGRHPLFRTHGKQILPTKWFIISSRNWCRLPRFNFKCLANCDVENFVASVPVSMVDHHGKSDHTNYAWKQVSCRSVNNQPMNISAELRGLEQQVPIQSSRSSQCPSLPYPGLKPYASLYIYIRWLDDIDV